MPNWCEGSIKIRGKKDNVEKFLTEGVNRYSWDFKTNESIRLPKDSCVNINEQDSYKEIDVWDAYIEGTRRAFIDELHAYIEPKDDEVCVVGAFRQAWCIDADSFDELKNKWDVDFRLYGVDCGMGFSQEVIAVRGGSVVNISDDYGGYDNFVWECPLPRLGG